MKHSGFQHQALIYEGPDDYLGGTMPFLESSLQRGTPVLIAVGGTQVEWLEEELGDRGPAVRFLPMEEVGRNPASIIPLWCDFLDEHSGGPITGIGEPVWAARSPSALDECHRHEALLNVAFRDATKFSLLCPYDAGSLPDETLNQVAVSHQHVCQDGEATESGAFDAEPDCLSGRLPAPAARPEVLNFGLTDLAEVRHRVVATAERAEMDSVSVADLVTAVSELAANSVMHGGGSGTLRLWCEEDGRLLAEVEDHGRIEEPLVGRLRPGINQEGGRGLWLANRLCDLVQIRSGESGTVVRLHLVDGQHAFV
jgi:anti-sigma regulatory factor (Ser/Thr protein kinase)